MSSVPRRELETPEQHMHRTHNVWKNLLCRMGLETVAQRLVAMHVKAAFRLVEPSRGDTYATLVAPFLDVQWWVGYSHGGPPCRRPRRGGPIRWENTLVQTLGVPWKHDISAWSRREVTEKLLLHLQACNHIDQASQSISSPAIEATFCAPAVGAPRKYACRLQWYGRHYNLEGDDRLQLIEMLHQKAEDFAKLLLRGKNEGILCAQRDMPIFSPQNSFVDIYGDNLVVMEAFAGRYAIGCGTIDPHVQGIEILARLARRGVHVACSHVKRDKNKLADALASLRGPKLDLFYVNLLHGFLGRESLRIRAYSDASVDCYCARIGAWMEVQLDLDTWLPICLFSSDVPAATVPLAECIGTYTIIAHVNNFLESLRVV